MSNTFRDSQRHTANLDQLLETSFFDVVLESERPVIDDDLTGGHGHGYGEGTPGDENADVSVQNKVVTSTTTVNEQEVKDTALPVVPGDDGKDPTPVKAPDVGQLRQQENAKLLELRGE
jgi:hypothetical protein